MNDTLQTPTDMSALKADPIQAGFQLGLIGAASGLSYAALRKAINARHGDNSPVSMVRPVLVGALLGSVAGAGTAKYRNGNIGEPRTVNTWSGVAGNISDNLYGKDAMDKSGAIPIGAIAENVGYFIPGVSTVLSGRDAFRNLRELGQRASQGNWWGAAGSGLKALGNVGMGLLGLVPGAGSLARGGVSLVARGGQAALRGLQGGKQIGGLAKLWSGASQAAATAGRKAIVNPMTKYVMNPARQMLGKPGKAITGLPNVGTAGREAMNLGSYANGMAKPMNSAIDRTSRFIGNAKWVPDSAKATIGKGMYNAGTYLDSLGRSMPWMMGGTVAGVANIAGESMNGTPVQQAVQHRIQDPRTYMPAQSYFSNLAGQPRTPYSGLQGLYP
jgi:hypothetical protein